MPDRHAEPDDNDWPRPIGREMVEWGMPPQFFYFDMGNVLLGFSHERMAEQMARVAKIDARRDWTILFEDGLHWAYERGS